MTNETLFNELELPVAEQPKEVAYPLNPTIYHLHRFDVDASKLAMSVHPATFSFKFPTVTIEGVEFFKIKDKWWQFAFVGSDDIGIYAAFYRIEGEYVPV